MEFGQSVYQNLVKKRWVLDEVCIRIWLKKDEVWTKCVLEFSKKMMGFKQSVYQNLVKK